MNKPNSGSLKVPFEVILFNSAGVSFNDGDNNATYVPNNTPDDD